MLITFPSSTSNFPFRRACILKVLILLLNLRISWFHKVIKFVFLNSIMVQTTSSPDKFNCHKTLTTSKWVNSKLSIFCNRLSALLINRQCRISKSKRSKPVRPFSYLREYLKNTMSLLTKNFPKVTRCLKIWSNSLPKSNRSVLLIEKSSPSLPLAVQLVIQTVHGNEILSRCKNVRSWATRMVV